MRRTIDEIRYRALGWPKGGPRDRTPPPLGYASEVGAFHSDPVFDFIESYPQQMNAVSMALIKVGFNLLDRPSQRSKIHFAGRIGFSG